jgi:hypothetical protein
MVAVITPSLKLNCILLSLQSYILLNDGTINVKQNICETILREVNIKFILRITGFVKFVHRPLCVCVSHIDLLPPWCQEFVWLLLYDMGCPVIEVSSF